MPTHTADRAEETEHGNDASSRKISLENNTGDSEKDAEDGSHDGDWGGDEYWLVIVLY